jgi:hypothetical protein
MSILLDMGISLFDLARIIHERFYCNRRYAAATCQHAAWRGMLAGRLATHDLDVLFQVRLSRERLRVGVPIALLHAMGPTRGVLPVSLRTVMNNAGL